MARASGAGRLRSIGALVLLFCIFAITGANPVNLGSESSLDDAVLLGQDALLVNETPVELGSAPEDQIPLTAVPGRPPPASSAGAAATPVPSVATTPQPSAVAKPQPVVSVPAAVGGKKDEKSDKSTEAAKTDPAPSKAPAVSSAGANSSAASSPSKASTPQPKSTGPPPPSGYAPTKEKCGRLPSLVRSTAKGRQTVSQQERDYLRRRRTKASRALRQWLRGVQRDEGQRFRVPATAPTLALTVSGGGLRSMLVGAGVVQALDEDDSNGPVSGLYQAMSYHAGLSGGAWLLASIVGNGFDRISGVAKNPWATSLLENNTLILTDNLKLMPERKAIVANDVSAKARAGFRPTPADPWGRASGYVTLRGKDGGAYQRLSDVRKSEKFRDHDVPYPIITALGMEDINGKLCDAVPTEGDYATQYEFSPHEFGSWQKGVEGFIPTELLGTAGVDGKPKDDVCVKNFDNLGFVIGISSMRFNEDCGHAGAGLLLLPPLNEIMQPEYRADPDKVDARRQLYAPIPNPFKSYSASPKVSKYDELYLFDGGQSNQNNPIWPLIQPARQVDVIFVNDNSADTDAESIGEDKDPLYNWPNGTELRHTYLMAKQFGLTKMPFIPDVATFTRQGLDKRASVFGCHDRNLITIVFLPNAPYNATMQGNQYTAKTDYNVTEQAGMIAYGQRIATQNNDDDWPLSLACIITHKHMAGGRVPAACTERLKRYCYVD